MADFFQYKIICNSFKQNNYHFNIININCVVLHFSTVSDIKTSKSPNCQWKYRIIHQLFSNINTIQFSAQHV